VCRLCIGACALAVLSGCGQNCLPVLCPVPTAEVYFHVVDGTGALVPAPQFSVSGSAVPATHVMERLADDGGIQPCDCWLLGLPPGEPQVTISAPQLPAKTVTVNVGSRNVSCCGVLPQTTLLEVDVTHH
jgi:hypothetical protein